MSLVAERPHNKYGSAILIRDDLKVDNVYKRVQGTVELITIVMSGVVVHSVYKPPNGWAPSTWLQRLATHSNRGFHGVMTQQITMEKRLSTQGHNSLLVKVLNEHILVNRVPSLDGSLAMQNCEKHLKDVPELGKLDVILHVVSKESIQSSTVRSEVPEIDCMVLLHLD